MYYLNNFACGAHCGNQGDVLAWVRVFNFSSLRVRCRFQLFHFMNTWGRLWQHGAAWETYGISLYVDGIHVQV